METSSCLWSSRGLCQFPGIIFILENLKGNTFKNFRSVPYSLCYLHHLQPNFQTEPEIISCNIQWSSYRIFCRYLRHRWGDKRNSFERFQPGKSRLYCNCWRYIFYDRLYKDSDIYPRGYKTRPCPCIRLFDLYTRIFNRGNNWEKRSCKNTPGKVQELRGNFYIFI